MSISQNSQGTAVVNPQGAQTDLRGAPTNLHTTATILEKLAQEAQKRVERAQQRVPLTQLKQDAQALPKGNFPFERALQKPGVSFICECKKASPSKGIIAPNYPYVEIAQSYEAAGADCISVLTEPTKFLGSLDHLQEISSSVSLPCLRKDFIVNEYMIYEAKIAGAAAVLLICSILSRDQLASYLSLCDELGLSALVETHDEQEIANALDAGARVIGVNNRNLHDFSVDTSLSARLRTLIPSGVLFVSESGIREPSDIHALQQCGVDAVLIGEALMRADDKTAALKELRGVS